MGTLLRQVTQCKTVGEIDGALRGEPAGFEGTGWVSQLIRDRSASLDLECDGRKRFGGFFAVVYQEEECKHGGLRKVRHKSFLE
mmetsp:Transcript_23241/g.53951  ORF Transcript_23241/g.53951 Transcript_23241/m.53951 type:complete len:84 (+) Transcript_23241:88-339(+)